MSADLGVCLVNWNTRDYLDTCLTSLRDHSEGLSLQVVVVDNASADGSAQMVRDKYPEVLLIANGENRFYAAANNQGLEELDAPAKLLLNPDIVVQPGSLRTLLDFLTEHPRAGAVAPRLVGPDGHLQHSCRTFPSPDVVFMEALGLSRLFPRHALFGKYRMGWWAHDTVRPVDQPMASALLLRASALEEIGLFDEAFPMFFNDVDLCRRLWEAQWQVWFTPQAEMIHIGGAATRQVRREMIRESHRSFCHYYRKHYRGHLDPVTYALAIGLLKVGEWWRVRNARS